LKYTYLAL